MVPLVAARGVGSIGSAATEVEPVLKVEVMEEVLARLERASRSSRWRGSKHARPAWIAGGRATRSFGGARRHCWRSRGNFGG